MGFRVATLLLMGLIARSTAIAAEQNSFWIASQFDWGKKLGFIFSLENNLGAARSCPLGTMRLVLAVGDGKDWGSVESVPKWEFDRDYRVRAFIGGGKAELWLDGKSAGTKSMSLAPAPGDISAYVIPGWSNAPTDYIVRLRSLKLTCGRKRAAYSFEKQLARPLPLVMFEPQLPQRLEWKTAVSDTLSFEVVFRLTRRPDAREFAPYVDRYGQCKYADWPGKVTSDEDIKRAAAEEERRLKQWGEPKDYDRYGGYTKAGWKETPTGFYKVVKRKGYWWLITPEGNPCFYVGLCTVPSPNWEQTSTSDREFLYEWLPPKTGPYTAAWGRNSMGETDGTEYVALHAANIIRKFGDDWQKKSVELATRRLRAWGFSGVGKWGGVEGLPLTPVLGSYGVPTLVDHPDVFDADVRAKFEEALRQQINKRISDPLVLGWSLGNEIHEIITAGEVRQIVGKPATPAKRALVDHVLKESYGGDVGKMAAAWAVEAKTVDDLCAAGAKPTSADVENMRRFYADRYYAFIYETVKKIDPNHLYFGFWIVPGWWENEEDWRLIAPHCDVIGYDLYSWKFADDLLMRLAKETDKPIFCGEFSYPAFYNGERGYGVYPTYAQTDKESGERYARYVEAAARYPYCVGPMWFHYRDQPLTGRGPGRGTDLVYGEHYAFGTLDYADRPKWDLVERMRAANLRAAGIRLQTMGR